MDVTTTFDRFSHLPYDMVVEIISRLPLIESFRLCSLRRDWHEYDLWLFCNSFELDEVKFMYTNARQYLINVGRNTKSFELKRNGKMRFIDFVNRTTAFLASPVLSKFSIRMFYANQYQANIDQWIEYALTKKVEELSLDFTDGDPLGTQPRGYNETQQYVLPNFLFQAGESIRVLTLDSVGLGFCNFQWFCILTSLTLRRTSITELMLTHIMYSCPGLETLCLSECVNVRKVEICSPGLRLKRLIVRRCIPLSHGIELHLPGLVYFEYVGSLVWFNLREMNGLDQFVLEFPGWTTDPYRFEEIRSFLSQVPNVKTFSLCAYALKVHRFDYLYGEEPLFQVSSIEQLTLKTRLEEYELPGILCLLQNSPRLKTITFTCSPARYRNDVLHYPHELCDGILLDKDQPFEHLQAIRVEGFTGKLFETELLKFLLRNSRSLCRVTIRKSIRCNSVMFSEAIAGLLIEDIASENMVIKWY